MVNDPSSSACKNDSDTFDGNQDSISNVHIASKGPANQLPVFEGLDNHAHNLGLQGQLDEADKGTQDIIMNNKNTRTEYLQLDEIHGAQGEQQHAIATYDDGLRCASSTDPSYMHAKNKAIERKNNYVDFIADLPFELIQCILVDLPKESKAACLHVSNVWRNRVLSCEMVWATVTVEDTIVDNCIVAVLPYVAAHVEYLTMGPSSYQLQSEYMRHMQSGSFTKIRSLHFNGNGLPDIPSSIYSQMYSQMKNTLTKLDLDNVDMSAGFTIADLLHTCRNLTRLFYRRACLFQDVVGDFARFDPYHHPLQDLQLSCHVNSARSIEPLLQRCQQLQRLVLNRGVDPVLDVVYKTCQNLRIFAFNPNMKITALEDLDVSDGRPGLYELYTVSGGYGAPPQGVLPFIRRSMDTIRIIVANISLTTAQSLGIAPYFSGSDRVYYGDLRFTNLQRLSYWSEATALFDPILLRSISACTTLRALTIVQVGIMREFIDTLMTLPPLEELDMSFTSEEGPIIQELVRLFQYYANHSRTHNICLSHCRSVTDDVLDALGDIKSLRTLALWELSNVSEDGLDRSLKKLSGVVTFLNLSEIRLANDRHLATVGTMQGLKKVKLQSLQGITNDGFLTMINTSETLEHLIVAECLTLTSVAYTIAREQLKKFDLNIAKDYD